MKINKKFALQLPKQDFYSFKLCTVDKVHAVRPVDNNNVVSKPEVQLTECLGGRKNKNKRIHSATLTKRIHL